MATVSNLSKGRPCTVVFDGYNSSPKDHEHSRRSNDYCANISLSTDTPCTVSKKRFMSNSYNKGQLITLLTPLLIAKGINVRSANDDADTLVVREVLAADSNVELHAEDTDILCMLVSHAHTVSNKLVMVTKSGKIDVQHIRQNLPSHELKVLLLAHAFSGSDTTSAIAGMGKRHILKKLAHKKAPHESIEVFQDIRAAKSDIENAGITIMQYFYGHQGVPLKKIRFDVYNQLVTNKKRKFKPQKLPPTKDAAIQHSLRVFLQVRDWKVLESQSLNPVEYGWERIDGLLQPIGFLGEVAPPEMMNVTSCNCKQSASGTCVNNRCSCKRMGVPCIAACGNCHGIGCHNSQTNDVETDEQHEDSCSDDEC